MCVVLVFLFYYFLFNLFELIFLICFWERERRERERKHEFEWVRRIWEESGEVKDYNQEKLREVGHGVLSHCGGSTEALESGISCHMAIHSLEIIVSHHLCPGN